jgi:hypothetical protein
MSSAKIFRGVSEGWIPAFTGMTGAVVIFDRCNKKSQKQSWNVHDK